MSHTLLCLSGDQNNPQVHLIIIREWSKKNTLFQKILIIPPWCILFEPSPLPLQLGTKEYACKVNLQSVTAWMSKKLFAWSRRDIWKLSDCNETGTHIQLVRKPILNHKAKLTCLFKSSSVCLRTKWLLVRVLFYSPADFTLLILPYILLPTRVNGHSKTYL